jgi:hypothetical protein
MKNIFETNGWLIATNDLYLYLFFKLLILQMAYKAKIVDYSLFIIILKTY